MTKRCSFTGIAAAAPVSFIFVIAFPHFLHRDDDHSKTGPERVNRLEIQSFPCELLHAPSQIDLQVVAFT